MDFEFKKKSIFIKIALLYRLKQLSTLSLLEAIAKKYFFLSWNETFFGSISLFSLLQKSTSLFYREPCNKKWSMMKTKKIIASNKVERTTSWIKHKLLEPKGLLIS